MKKNILKTYYDLTKAKKEIEQKIQKTKEILMKELEKKGGHLETKSFTCDLIECERESFKLKDALRVFDRRQLMPFITQFVAKRIDIRKIA